MKNAKTKIVAKIHHFFIDPETGEPQYDEENFPMIGHYFQLEDQDSKPICELTGPYNSDEEAANACVRAWKTKTY